MKRKKPKQEQFSGILLSGHKDDAVEVPFDPSEVWGIDAKPLWRGRRGYPVQGTLNETQFEGYVVPRSRKFYLLVDKDLKRTVKVAVGETVAVKVSPLITR